MAPIIPILKEKGIRVIGIGTDFGSENFFKAGYWKGEFFISPNHEIYKRVPQFKRVALAGLGGLFHVKKTAEAKKRMKEEIGAETFDHLPMNLKGTDPFYGGTLILGPGNVLHFAYFNQISLDWVNNSEILKQCGIDPASVNIKNLDPEKKEVVDPTRN
jgi:hypothetical protein